MTVEYPVSPIRKHFGKWFLVQIQETVSIPNTPDENGYYWVELSEVPAKPTSGVPAPSCDTLRLTHNQPDPGEFFVDYDKGWIYFNAVDKGNDVTVDFHGSGSPVSANHINDLSRRLDPTNYLSKFNVAAYTPTTDYHPATKKYVDDNSLNPTNYLAKDNTDTFTPTGDYNPATKKYVDDNIGSGDHNDLSNLDGGQAGEYYHLTNSEHGSLAGANGQHLELRITGAPQFAGLDIIDSSPNVAIRTNSGSNTRLRFSASENNRVANVWAEMDDPQDENLKLRLGVDLASSNPEKRSINIDNKGYVGIDGNPTDRNVVSIYEDQIEDSHTLLQLVANSGSPWAFIIRNHTFSTSTSPAQGWRMYLADDGTINHYAAVHPSDPNLSGDIGYRTNGLERLRLRRDGEVWMRSLSSRLIIERTDTPDDDEVQLSIVNNGSARMRLTDTSFSPNPAWDIYVNDTGFYINDGSDDNLVITDTGQVSIRGSLMVNAPSPGPSAVHFTNSISRPVAAAGSSAIYSDDDELIMSTPASDTNPIIYRSGVDNRVRIGVVGDSYGLSINTTNNEGSFVTTWQEETIGGVKKGSAFTYTVRPNPSDDATTTTYIATQMSTATAIDRTNNFNTIVQTDTTTVHRADGDVIYMIGNRINSQVEADSIGNVSNLFSIQTKVSHTGTGTISQAVNLEVNSPTGTGTITTVAGVRIQAQARAGITNAYGINQVGSSDLNRFAGKIQSENVILLTNLAQPAADPTGPQLWNDAGTLKCIGPSGTVTTLALP